MLALKTKAPHFINKKNNSMNKIKEQVIKNLQSIIKICNNCISDINEHPDEKCDIHSTADYALQMEIVVDYARKKKVTNSITEGA